MLLRSRLFAVAFLVSLAILPPVSQKIGDVDGDLQARYAGDRFDQSFQSVNFPNAIFAEIDREQNQSSNIERFADTKVLIAAKVDNLAILSSKELLELATCDLLVTYALRWNVDQISELRSLNPRMRIFGYHNVGFIDERETDINLSNVNYWVLKDATGQEVFAKQYPFLKLIDPGNLEYQEWVSELIRYRMNDLVQIDGVMADGTSALIDPYSVSARPVNPRTRLPYQDQEWRDDMLGLVKLIKERLGKQYIANGGGLFCGSGDAGFWKNKELAEPLLNEVDGVFLEGLIRWPGESLRSEESWRKDLEYLDLVTGKAKQIIVGVYISDVPLNEPSENALVAYGFATYLLGLSGVNTYFWVGSSDSKFHNTINVDIGHPVEEFRTCGNRVFEREFNNATVFLNPSDADSTIHLESNFTNPSGQIFSEMNLLSKNAIILVKNR